MTLGEGSNESIVWYATGSNEYVTAAFAERAIDEARRILKLISSLLLDRDSTGAPNTGISSPDEHNCLMRYTIRSKVTHLLRTLPPSTASQHSHVLHSELLDSHLNVDPHNLFLMRPAKHSYFPLLI